MQLNDFCCFYESITDEWTNRTMYGHLDGHTLIQKCEDAAKNKKKDKKMKTKQKQINWNKNETVTKQNKIKHETR